METLTKTLYLEEETNFFFHNLRLQLSFKRQFYIYLRRDEWDHRRKHDRRPQISNLISVYEAAMNPRDIKPAADKLILAGSTCRSCIFFFFPLLFFSFCLLSRDRHDTRFDQFVSAHGFWIFTDRERERRSVLSRVVFDSTKNMEQGREGTKLTNKWHE